jgi:hypothetical protein
VGSEHFLEGVESMLRLADSSHDWHGIQLAKDSSSVSNLLLSPLSPLCCHHSVI